MVEWEYGGHYRTVNMEGVIDLPHGSKVQVCDWTVDPLPDFMLEADTLFVDPPWNAALARGYYTKADLPHGPVDYWQFATVMLGHVDRIAPQCLFLEIGKQAVDWYVAELRRRWPFIAVYRSTYYQRPSNRGFVLCASQGPLPASYEVLSGLDEADAIKWIGRHHPYQCIGDLCMGRGAVGLAAYAASRRFVGTELNPKRLAVLVAALGGGRS